MRGHLNSVRGVVSSLAGPKDDADAIFSQVQAEAANVRRRVATYGHQAFARVRACDPEAACAALGQSIDLALHGHYAMGLKRVAGVRAGFDSRWESLRCVRDLDDRLRQLVVN
jgi:hypothetical protein